MQPQKTHQPQSQQQPIKFGPFNLFQIIKKSHNNYGIKTTDYRRYKNYCVRKIRKIRKSMNYKFGTKNKFFKKDIVKDNAGDKKILDIVLWNSEKYWAEANQTKYSPQRNAAHKSRARFVSIKKLKKAIKWSTQLCKLSKQKSTYLSLLQSNAYNFYLQGMLAFEQQSWSEAQSKLIAARQVMEVPLCYQHVFQQLIKTSSSVNSELFKQKIDQFDQTIKFCNFKISKGKDMSISEIIQMKKIGDPNLSNLIQTLTQQRLNEMSLQQTTNNKNEIKFGQQRFTVKEESIIQQKSKIDSEIKVLEEMKSKSLKNLEDKQLQEELLQQYSKIVVLIEEGIKLCEQQLTKKSDKYNESEKQVLKKLSLLYQQLKTELFISRSFTIFHYNHSCQQQKRSPPQTLAKLLTTITNNFLQLSQIVKQKHTLTATSSIEELKSIQQKMFYLRMLRLLFVGQVYEKNDKIKQAYGLWKECEKALNILETKEEMKTEKQRQLSASDHLNCTLVPLTEIQQQLKQAKLKCLIKNYFTQSKQQSQVNKMMQQINVKTTQKSHTNLTLEELIEKDDISVLDNISLQKLSEIEIIKLPGNLEPVPTRPVFFDIYETQLHYPNLDNKLKTKSKGLWGNIFGKFYK